MSYDMAPICMCQATQMSNICYNYRYRCHLQKEVDGLRIRNDLARAQLQDQATRVCSGLRVFEDI